MAKTNTKVAIYELRDPNDGKTYYVGKSIHPRQRYAEHLTDARARPRSEKGRWILRLLRAGQAPQLHVINVVPFEQWVAAEAVAIRAHFQNKSPLTNVVVPRGTRPPKPEVYIRSQEYWDDLSPEVSGVQRRMFPFRHPEGYGLTVLLNAHSQGWRYAYDLFADGTTYSFDHIVRPYKDGYPPGFRTLTGLVQSENWWERAVFDTMSLVRDPTPDTWFTYQHMSPVESFEPEQLGYWATDSQFVAK